MHLQDLAAHADRTVAVTGIAGTKWMMQRRFGYGGVTRLPLRPLDDSVGETLKAHPHCVAIEEMEKSLEKGSKSVPAVAKPILNGNGVTTNGVPVSSDSTGSPASASTAESTASSSPVSDKRPAAHVRSSSLSGSLRSFIGSLRGKKSSAVA